MSVISCLNPLLTDKHIKKHPQAHTACKYTQLAPLPLLLPLRHHLQLGGHLHPSHQQRLESHPVHLDHQFLQRAGGTLTLSLAETTHFKKRPQKSHLLHNLHGRTSGPLLPATSLPPVTECRRSSLRLIEAGTFLAL